LRLMTEQLYFGFCGCGDVTTGLGDEVATERLFKTSS